MTKLQFYHPPLPKFRLAVSCTWPGCACPRTCLYSRPFEYFAACEWVRALRDHYGPNTAVSLIQDCRAVRTLLEEDPSRRMGLPSAPSAPAGNPLAQVLAAAEAACAEVGGEPPADASPEEIAAAQRKFQQAFAQKMAAVPGVQVVKMGVVTAEQVAELLGLKARKEAALESAAVYELAGNAIADEPPAAAWWERLAGLVWSWFARLPWPAK